MSARSLGYRARDEPRERPALTVVWCGSAEQRDERVVNLAVLEPQPLACRCLRSSETERVDVPWAPFQHLISPEPATVAQPLFGQIRALSAAANRQLAGEH